MASNTNFSSPIKVPFKFTNAPNNRMQPDFGKLRLPQPLMRSVIRRDEESN